MQTPSVPEHFIKNSFHSVLFEMAPQEVLIDWEREL